jgi:hypothetical protein
MDRRSFLFRVAGGVLIAGTALIAGSESEAKRRRRRPAPRQMLVDADPRDPARPASSGLPNSRRRTGITDSDPSDPVGEDHRRARRRSGLTDRDPTDPAGAGQGLRQRFVICPGNARCPRRLP